MWARIAKTSPKTSDRTHFAIWLNPSWDPEHVADLNQKVAVPCLSHDLLPARPVIARRFVVPHMLAGSDNRRRLLKALVVTAFRCNCNDRRIVEDLLCV